jgi:hypothetical protein
MIGRLRRWWTRPPSERWLLLRLVLGLPLVALLLRLVGYGRARNLLRRLAGHGPVRSATEIELRQAEQLAQFAAIAGRRGLLSATCLRQALLVDYLLRRRGLAPELKLGVRKREGRFDAHAWVELEGRPLAQAGLEHSPFPDAGAAGS